MKMTKSTKVVFKPEEATFTVGDIADIYTFCVAQLLYRFLSRLRKTKPFSL